MRGNEFLDKMELIDPAYVEAADKKPVKQRGAWIKWGATAACLFLVVSGVLSLRQHAIPGWPLSPNSQSTPVPGSYDSGMALYPAETTPPEQSSLGTTEIAPNVSLSSDAITIPALQVNAGFEGYMCYDLSELDNGNPWSEEMNITSLPVYKNLAYDPTGAGIPRGLNEAEMMVQLNSVATALNLEMLETEFIRDGYVEKNGEWVLDETPTRIETETNNGIITVEADGSIEYCLPEDGLALPSEYHFTNSNTTAEEATKVLSYFMEEYKSLLNWTEPRANTFGDYDIFGDFYRSYSLYDASGNDADDILNYNFCYIQFYPNEQGHLTLIRIKNGLENAEKIKDYPIITIQEATERLCNGNYQSSVPLEFPGESSIEKVELAYRTGRLEEILLPYYRFYVLLPDSMNTRSAELGLKTYGIYYVPALPDEYIINMPTYDGRFN